MAKAKVYGAVSRAYKGRLKPTDKHGKESWKRRDAARKEKQEAYAANAAAKIALVENLLANAIADNHAMLAEGE